MWKAQGTKTEWKLEELSGGALMAFGGEDEAGGQEGATPSGESHIVNGATQLNAYPIMINLATAPSPHNNLQPSQFPFDFRVRCPILYRHRGRWDRLRACPDPGWWREAGCAGTFSSYPRPPN